MKRQTQVPAPGEVAEEIGDIRPADPDIALAAAYMARYATVKEVAEFERRFVLDDAFANKVAPLMKLWALPVTLRELMERAPIELRAERQDRLRREAAAVTPAAVAAEPEPPPSAPPAQSAVAKSAPNTPEKAKRVRGPNFVLTVVNVAASIVIILGLALQYMVSRGPRARLLEQGFVVGPPPDSGSDSAVRKAGVIPGPSATGAPRLYRVPQPPPAPAAPPETVRVTPAAPTTGRGTPVPGVGGLDGMKPMLFSMGQKFSTGPGETKLIELENGAVVLLRPNSIIAYRPMLLLPGMPERVREMVIRMGTLALEGEAAIVVPAGSGYGVAVASDAGLAHLESGWFAVRCAKGCPALQVTVHDGQGSLSNLADSSSHVFLKKGQLGLAPRLDAPSIVDKSAASLFPQPDSTLRATRKVP